MQVSRAWQVAGALALGVGATLAFGACTNRGGGGSDAATGPMGDLTKDLMGRIKPGSTGPLSLAVDGLRVYHGEDGRLQGTVDARRLLGAADAHAYGTPLIIDVTKDVRGDGLATFNEVRQVARHFDVDGNLEWSVEESLAFEHEAGIDWIPGTG